MPDRLSLEQWNALDNSTKAFMRTRGLEPPEAAAQGTPAIPPVAVHPTPPANAPAQGLPDLNGIPDQSGGGPAYLPFAAFDIEATLDQVQNRFSERSGPNFYAVITVTRASEESIRAGIAEGQTRAFYWPYNTAAFGKEADKSRASLVRYKTFVRQVCGLPEGSNEVNARSADLLAESRTKPSLGRRIRVISIQGGERREKPGTFYYNTTIIPLG